ncbi:hypothetical protein O3G_MSEX009059 [Manduca sexta]|nr:hypothetical protein O3G_MSEX009059 [Manduca sexta]
MALALIKECRNMNVDCIVAPYEADAQLAYLNIKNIAQLVITEDSDLILFGCNKVFFKMDLEGRGTLVDTIKLPLVMKCPIEHYTFDKFRRMCIMSGCDYLASLPGIGLAKARQFVTTTQDPSFANALRKVPSFFKRPSLIVTDDYRESFLKAEATFKHQYVYDPIDRAMVRLTDPDDEDIEKALCVNAGELLDPDIAFQLALGNLDPFTLEKMDDWHPDHRSVDTQSIKTGSWKQKLSKHPSIWSTEYRTYLDNHCPWKKKVKKLEPIIAKPQTRPRQNVHLVSRNVPETQDESLSVEALSQMYMIPASKRQKLDLNDENGMTQTDDEMLQEITQKEKSPILENKQRSFKKFMSNGLEKRLSKFPKTIIGNNVVESKFFNNSDSGIVIMESEDIEDTRTTRNPFKIKIESQSSGFDTQCSEIPDSQFSDMPESQLPLSQKENIDNSPTKRPISPILDPSPHRNPFKTLTKMPTFDVNTQDSVIEDTFSVGCLDAPIDSQTTFCESPVKSSQATTSQKSPPIFNSQPTKFGAKTNGLRKTPLKKTVSLPSNQPTLLSKFGFQKKPMLRKS